VGAQKEGEEVPVVDAPKRQGDKECPHGKFEPLISFFRQSPPPNPADLPFYTSFGVGVGRAWFVEGVKVLQTENGWTDVDKQCSLGNLVWPRPTLDWEGDERTDKVPTHHPRWTSRMLGMVAIHFDSPCLTRGQMPKTRSFDVSGFPFNHSLSRPNYLTKRMLCTKSILEIK